MADTFNFLAEIKKFGAEAERRTDQIFLAAVIELHTSVRTGSTLTGSPGAPKDTGYLQNSIQVGRAHDLVFLQSGEGPHKDLLPASPSVTGLAGLKLGEDVLVATNTVYAEVQEHMHKTHANHWALSQAGWPRIVEFFAEQVMGRE